MRLRMNFRQGIWVLALVLGIGITGGAMRAAPSPSTPGQAQQDYSKNKSYQVGMRDGKVDKTNNKDHSRKRKFKKDDDHNAYEAGYQEGHR